MTTWAQRVIELVNASDAPPAKITAPTVTRPAEPFTRARPVPARLARNTLLTPASAAKEVRQLGFDISEHDVSYAVGDSLGVLPTNSDADVAAWLAATGLCGDEVVEIDGAECALRQALTDSYDICRITPNLLDFLAGTTADKAAARDLRAARAHLDTWRLGRNGIDVVRAFGVHAAAEQWQEVLVRLTPRLYSISSSPLVSPHEVQLTVSIVRYLTPDGSERGGVCSTFLADRAGDVPVFLQKSPHFRPPEDTTAPIVMIGAGTGIAPFRGFLQERRALGHTGRNWLFFGDRHRAQNFYYCEDLTDMATDGFLNRLDLAFSRDQRKRIYVQDNMIDKGAQLWSWLQDGAHLYVCGDAATMARDVDAALETIIGTHGHLSRRSRARLQARTGRRQAISARRVLTSPWRLRQSEKVVTLRSPRAAKAQQRIPTVGPCRLQPLAVATTSTTGTPRTSTPGTTAARKSPAAT